MRKHFLLLVVFALAGLMGFGQPVVITPPSATIEPGGSVTLTATGATYYQWSPATGLSVTEGPVTVASPMVTTTYTCEGYAPGAESVINSDFNQGNTGFTSAYEYNTNLWAEGTYYVDSDASLHHENFHGYGHGGSGNFMMVNGATNPGTNVWTQQISVLPNKWYAFSTWACTLAGSANQVALLQFSINGTQIGAVFSAPPQTMVWEQFYELWYSGNSTSATITILNQNTGGDGNDFGLDDISFRELVLVGNPTCTVYVNSMTATATADDTELCEGETTTLHALPTGGSGNYSYSWTPANTLSDPNVQHPEATPPVGSTTYTCHITDIDWGDSRSVSIDITVHPIYDETFITEFICSGESYPFYDSIYSSTIQTFYTDHSIHGCDSIVHLDLTVYPPNDTTLVKASICVGQTYNFHGDLYNLDGDIAHFDTIDNHGCPKVEKLVLSVDEYQTPEIQNEFVCYGHDETPYFKWDKNNVEYYADTYDEVIVPDPNGGCDFKYRLNLKFHQEFYCELPPIIVCDEYYWPISGETYNGVGNHIIPKTIQHSFGDVECDSTYVLNLTINESSTQESFTFEGECDAVVFPWFGETLYFTKDCDTLLSGLTPDSCLYEVNLHIRNMQYTPTPVIAYTEDSNYHDGDIIPVITNTEFFSFQYDFFVVDSLSHFDDWDSCVWHISKESWLIEPNPAEYQNEPDRRYCRVYVAEHDNIPTELSCTVYNSHCEPYSITKRFYLKSSFFGTEEPGSARLDFSVIPNPNNGNMELRFENMGGRTNVKVYDMTGNLVDRFDIHNEPSSQTLPYSLRQYASGIYLFVATNRAGTVAKKVVINR